MFYLVIEDAQKREQFYSSTKLFPFSFLDRYKCVPFFENHAPTITLGFA